MIHAQDNPTRSPLYLDRLDDPLPTLPDRAGRDELFAIMNATASHFWRCQIALSALFAMPTDEREATPNYLDLLNAARLGMSAARSLQERATARLALLSALPDRWQAWPERRTVPRAPTFG